MQVFDCRLHCCCNAILKKIMFMYYVLRYEVYVFINLFYFSEFKNVHRILKADQFIPLILSKIVVEKGKWLKKIKKKWNQM